MHRHPSKSKIKFSIKDAQKATIRKVLALNKDTFDWDHDGEEGEEEVWKVLVYDKRSRNILSPLFKVGELRKQGITVHMEIESSRQHISDVPVIYLLRPTEDNINRITKDCSSKLYDTCHINFVHNTTQDQLQIFAEKIVSVSAVGRINKIFDQYVDYISLEDNLFTLDISNSFVAFNSPADDAEAEANLEAVTESLFCIIISLGVVPVIQSPPSGAAYMVARKLNERLANHIAKSGSISLDPSRGSASSFQRPVLILLDRTVDLMIMAHHTWTYQALVHDLLGMRLNTVKVNVESEGPGETVEVKSYDLDSSSDAFWAETAGSPMPKVPVKIKTYVSEYRSALDQVERLKRGSPAEEGRSDDILQRTKELETLVSGVPELTEKKRLIDMHTNVATALFSLIESRSWDNFFSMEEGIMTKTILDKRAVLGLISGDSGTPEDKLRLFIIYYLSQKDVPEDDIKEFERVLESAGVDLAPVAYIKTHKDYGRLLTTSTAEGSSRGNIAQSGYVDSIASIFKKSYNKVKMLVPQKKEFYITRVVDAIMDLKPDMEVERYAYFDPKVYARHGSTIPRVKKPFKEAIVFVIGGGNYVEYQNLQDYAKASTAASDLETPKTIIYGTTEMCTGGEFISQLTTTAVREGLTSSYDNKEK